MDADLYPRLISFTRAGYSLPRNLWLGISFFAPNAVMAPASLRRCDFERAILRAILRLTAAPGRLYRLAPEARQRTAEAGSARKGGSFAAAVQGGLRPQT